MCGEEMTQTRALGHMHATRMQVASTHTHNRERAQAGCVCVGRREFIKLSRRDG